MSAAKEEHASALESTLPPYWSISLGQRAFQFDAFLSHNQSDGSNELAVALRRAGAKVWRDDDSDMSDQRIRDKVNKAINASRYLVVCIGPTFRDSEWVRAEYLPALFQSRLHGFERVIVADAATGLVPEELQICRLFDWSDIPGLASFVKFGNQLDFDPHELVDAYPRPEVMVSLGPGRETELRRLHEMYYRLLCSGQLSDEELHRGLARGLVCKVCLDAIEHPQRFDERDLLRNDQDVPTIAGAVVALASIDPELLSRLSVPIRFMAWKLTDSPMAGIRACGLQMLFALASARPDDLSVVADVFAFLMYEAGLPDRFLLQHPDLIEAAHAGHILVTNPSVVYNASNMGGFDAKTAVEWTSRLLNFWPADRR